MESLRSQLNDLQEELKRKEQRWSASSARLRDRISALETENAELKEEIRTAERKRLEMWEQREKATKPKVSSDWLIPSHFEYS